MADRTTTEIINYCLVTFFERKKRTFWEILTDQGHILDILKMIPIIIYHIVTAWVVKEIATSGKPSPVLKFYNILAELTIENFA